MELANNGSSQKREILLGIERPALPFLRMLHNPKSFEGNVARVSFGAIMLADDYLSKVSDRAQERGKNSQYCPYVRHLEANNAYYIKALGHIPTEGDVRNALRLLLDSYQKIPPVFINGGKFDYKALVYVFAHPAARAEEFCQMVSKISAENRLSFRSVGLMLGEFHPYHALGGRDGGEEPMFVSKVPIFIVRSMHKSDEVFMKTEQDTEIYNKHFPKAPFVNLPQGFLGC